MEPVIQAEMCAKIQNYRRGKVAGPASIYFYNDSLIFSAHPSAISVVMETIHYYSSELERRHKARAEEISDLRSTANKLLAKARKTVTEASKPISAEPIEIESAVITFALPIATNVSKPFGPKLATPNTSVQALISIGPLRSSVGSRSVQIIVNSTKISLLRSFHVQTDLLPEEKGICFPQISVIHHVDSDGPTRTNFHVAPYTVDVNVDFLIHMAQLLETWTEATGWNSKQNYYFSCEIEIMYL
jgi:hypothetical protein